MFNAHNIMSTISQFNSAYGAKDFADFNHDDDDDVRTCCFVFCFVDFYRAFLEYSPHSMYFVILLRHCFDCFAMPESFFTPYCLLYISIVSMIRLN